MGRSVVHAGAARCPRCNLPPRWCVCDVLPPVTIPFHVHVLIHRQEHAKPSSTGKLVVRTVAGARSHVYQRATRFHAASGVPPDAVPADGTLWIAHPAGDDPPDVAATALRHLHLLLLDGTWRQAGEMLRSVEGRGRLVRLPDAAASPSRYWLRDQPGPGRLSTAEALLGVLRHLGDDEAQRLLRLHFELHVHATLLSRGRREMAQKYLGESPLLDALPTRVASGLA